MTKRQPPDSRVAAARYRLDANAAANAAANADAAAANAAAAATNVAAEPVTSAGQPSPDERAQIVEIAIQQAMRRGDFDGLPGAGKPLQQLGAVRDPDWWIRRKIEREGLRGLGPAAFTLKTEDAGLDDRLDGLSAESAVREVLDSFNLRVRDARRQLQGGPPVFTRPRDVEAEVDAWRRRAVERRAARQLAIEQQQARRAAELAAMTWRERRRARRHG